MQGAPIAEAKSSRGGGSLAALLSGRRLPRPRRCPPATAPPAPHPPRLPIPNCYPSSSPPSLARRCFRAWGCACRCGTLSRLARRSSTPATATASSLVRHGVKAAAAAAAAARRHGRIAQRPSRLSQRQRESVPGLPLPRPPSACSDVPDGGVPAVPRRGARGQDLGDDPGRDQVSTSGARGCEGARAPGVPLACCCCRCCRCRSSRCYARRLPFVAATGVAPVHLWMAPWPSPLRSPVVVL